MLTNSIVVLDTVYKYVEAFRRLCKFFEKQYPDLNSFINGRYPMWSDLKLLSRKDMEDYFSWLRIYVGGHIKTESEYLIFVKIFLEYIQKAKYKKVQKIIILISYYLCDLLVSDKGDHLNLEE